MTKRLKTTADLPHNVHQSGTVKRLFLPQLLVDPSYQRGVKHTSIQMAQNLKLPMIGNPVIGERSSDTGEISLWIIDGQQRINALLINDVRFWDCLVIPSTGPEFEARVFQTINSKRLNVSTLEQFKAAVTAKDPVALAVIEAIRVVGMKYIPVRNRCHYSTETQEAAPTCFQTMYSIAGWQDGGQILQRTLRLIGQTWPKDVLALSSLFVLTVARILRRNPDLMDDHFVKMVRSLPSVKVIQQSKVGGYGAHINVQNLLVRTYNKRLRKNKLPFFTEQGYTQGD